MNFKNLASSLLNKFILGSILASAIILAVVYFLQVYHTYLTQFSNGSTIESITYAIILIAATTGIYFLVYDNKPNKKTDVTSLPLPIDVETLGMKFLEGFMDGVGKRSNNSPTS